jgi:hypothetical protein
VFGIIRAIIAIANLIASSVFLRYAPAPFIWILFLWFAFLLYSTVTSKSTAAKLVCLNIGIVFLILGVYEAYLWTGSDLRRQDECPTGVVTRHDILGYAPKMNTVAPHRRSYGNELAFDVVYSIDSTGLRVSPPYDRQDSKVAILFFGGSFTFGSGVNDEETMPYVTGTKTNGEYHVYNFAYRGYGAHQMLSALEHGIVDSILEDDPEFVIYQAIIDHVPRAAGLRRWGTHGPRYILSEDGKAVYAGHFDDTGGPVFVRLKPQLMKSKIARLIVETHQNRHAHDQANIELFASIVDASRTIVETSYPGCEFHVIFWNSRKPASEAI